MTWTEPKTNWTFEDYINVDPDYNRIKGNIEYLADKISLCVDLPSASIETLPRASFFNSVNASVLDIYRRCNNETLVRYIRTNYEANFNGVWSYNELNEIENILLMAHNVVKILPIIEFMLGGDSF